MSHKHNPNEKRTTGFTLVELLVVIGLIAFMGGMITYALLGAQTDARASRTRGTIQKLNEVILQQWEEYRYRSIDYRSGSYVPAQGTAIKPFPRTSVHLRMMVMRDTMRMEMPDRAGDLLFGPSQYTVPKNFPSVAQNQGGSYVAQRAYSLRFGTLYNLLYQAIDNSPSLTQVKQSYPLLKPQSLSSTESIPGLGRPHSANSLSAQQISEWIAAWDAVIQPSELLYLIISTANYGGAPALELFRPSEIADPDGDGLLEFIDAWGKPIQWIRWPAGYPSDLNRYANTDALDPLRTDWRFTDTNYVESNRPQTVVPLIVSSGDDEEFGVRFTFPHSQTGQPVPIVYARMGSGSTQSYIDPFFTWDFQNNMPNGPNSEPPYLDSDSRGYRANQLGSISDFDRAADDITNHDLILEP